VIKEVYVANFRSIKGASVALSSPTVVIGKNGSGKTTLFAALNLLRFVISNGVSKTFDSYFSPYRDVFEANSVSGEKLKIGVTASLPNSDVVAAENGFKLDEFRYSVTFSFPKNGRTAIQEEELEWFHNGETHNTITASAGSEGYQSLLLFSDHNDGGVVGLEHAKVVDFIKSWKFIKIIPKNVRSVRHETESMLHPNYAELNDSSLKEFIACLSGEPSCISEDVAKRIIVRMRHVSPMIDDILVVRSETTGLQTKRLVKRIKCRSELYENLSDGEIRVLILLSMLNYTKPVPVLFIDEIDSGLDPMSLNLLVSEIQSSLADTQVITIAYSPYFLDLMSVRHLVVAEDERSESTYFRPEDNEDTLVWAEEFSAGMLWTMGRLSSNTTRG